MAIQDKFNRPNVIYKITKDIDLQGETLTIPEGCTLDFQGGSFKNGNIVGNNTAIQAFLTKIFGLDVELSGTWNVVEAYPEWFGAVTNKNIDQSVFINKSFKYFNEVKLQGNLSTYYIHYPIVMRSYQRLSGMNMGNDNTIIRKVTNKVNTSLPENYKVDACIIIIPKAGDESGDSDSKKCTIKDIRLVSASQCKYGIYVYYGHNHLFEDITAFGFQYCIKTIKSWRCSFERVEVTACWDGQTNPFAESIGFCINKDETGGGYTTMVFRSTYANNYHIGYYMTGTGYSIFDNAGCDSSIIAAYVLNRCGNVCMNACGCEFTKFTDDDISANYYFFYSHVLLNACSSSSSGKHPTGTNTSDKYLLKLRNNSNIIANCCNFESTSDLADQLKMSVHGYSYLSITPKTRSNFNGSKLDIDEHSSVWCFTSGYIETYINSNIMYPIQPDKQYTYKTNGNTASRPTYAPVGFQYYDTDLNKPIWKKITTKSTWVDATGAEV